MEYVLINPADVPLAWAKEYGTKYNLNVVSSPDIPHGWMLFVSEAKEEAWWREYIPIAAPVEPKECANRFLWLYGNCSKCGEQHRYIHEYPDTEDLSFRYGIYNNGE